MQGRVHSLRDNHCTRARRTMFVWPSFSGKSHQHFSWYYALVEGVFHTREYTYSNFSSGAPLLPLLQSPERNRLPTTSFDWQRLRFVWPGKMQLSFIYNWRNRWLFVLFCYVVRLQPKWHLRNWSWNRMLCGVVSNRGFIIVVISKQTLGRP